MSQYYGNLSSGELILKSEVEATDYHWIKLQRHKYNETTFETKTSTAIQAYCKEEWAQFVKTINRFGLNTPEKLRAVLNWDSWTLIHNPELIKTPDQLEALKIK